MAYPNVPNYPGVPPLPRAPGPTLSPTIRSLLGLLEGVAWRVFQVETRWGIYNSAGQPLWNPAAFGEVTSNILNSIGLGSTVSTASVDYSKETRVSDFPIERGSFASYNKVEMPAAPTVVLCMEGRERDRSAFLQAVDLACKSVDLYTLVTPERAYINYSIERYNYARHNAKGANLLIVEFFLKEIRQVSAILTQSSKINQPQNVGAVPQADNGKVQAQPPDVSTLKSITNRLFN